MAHQEIIMHLRRALDLTLRMEGEMLLASLISMAYLEASEARRRRKKRRKIMPHGDDGQLCGNHI